MMEQEIDRKKIQRLFQGVATATDITPCSELIEEIVSSKKTAQERGGKNYITAECLMYSFDNGKYYLHLVPKEANPFLDGSDVSQLYETPSGTYILDPNSSERLHDHKEVITLSMDDLIVYPTFTLTPGKTRSFERSSICRFLFGSEDLFEDYVKTLPKETICLSIPCEHYLKSLFNHLDQPEDKALISPVIFSHKPPNYSPTVSILDTKYYSCKGDFYIRGKKERGRVTLHEETDSGQLSLATDEGMLTLLPKRSNLTPSLL